MSAWLPAVSAALLGWWIGSSLSAVGLLLWIRLSRDRHVAAQDLLLRVLVVSHFVLFGLGAFGALRSVAFHSSGRPRRTSCCR